MDWWFMIYRRAETIEGMKMYQERSIRRGS
jgi:hypothetical protein